MELLGQLRNAGLFTARVPRYTSYPPVSDLVPGEGALHQKRWLNEVPHGADLSIYVHIPYCEKLCWFCACRTQTAEDRSAVDSYLRVLCSEIEIVRRELPTAVTLSRLYLGGGTPTLLSAAQMQSLMGCLNTAFPRSPDFECSVEIDTTSLVPGLAPELIAQGMTRAVVGVQDFSPQVQASIGRHQNFEQTLAVVRQLREAGLERLDMELLYGLPAQTTASIAETTQQILALEPDRLAVCEYAHVPNLAKRQVLVDARRLPPAEDSFLLSQVARRILLSDGYESVGMDHYVRPGDRLISARDAGHLHRDFQGYSDSTAHALIGFGASAISRFPQGYSQNASATSAYVKAVSVGHLPGDLGYRLTGTDVAIACMIDMLLCRFEIDIAMVAERFPASTGVIDRAIQNIGSVFGSHVEITPEMMMIKPAAYPLARLIAHILDRIGHAQDAGPGTAPAR